METEEIDTTLNSSTARSMAMCAWVSHIPTESLFSQLYIFFTIFPLFICSINLEYSMAGVILMYNT